MLQSLKTFLLDNYKSEQGLPDIHYEIGIPHSKLDQFLSVITDEHLKSFSVDNTNDLPLDYSFNFEHEFRVQSIGFIKFTPSDHFYIKQVKNDI